MSSSAATSILRRAASSAAVAPPPAASTTFASRQRLASLGEQAFRLLGSQLLARPFPRQVLAPAATLQVFELSPAPGVPVQVFDPVAPSRQVLALPEPD